ncbi:MAG: hypothetical protein KatS3mg087_1013 [Patescibacteria group bacterium]|nr:MAG: hypothetical protein KatS3mg087_1013 [Patescibacteria group bacterium]
MKRSRTRVVVHRAIDFALSTQNKRLAEVFRMRKSESAKLYVDLVTTLRSKSYSNSKYISASRAEVKEACEYLFGQNALDILANIGLIKIFHDIDKAKVLNIFYTKNKSRNYRDHCKRTTRIFSLASN